MIGVNLDWDALMNATACLLLVVFGIWLWTLKPRTRLTRMLGLYAVAHGVVYFLENLFTFDGLTFPGVLTDIGYAAASWGLLATAREVLRPLGDRGLRVWRWAVVGMGLLVTAQIAAVRYTAAVLDVRVGVLDILGTALFTAFMINTAVLPLVFAWLHRYPPEGHEDAVRRQAPLLSAALVMWPGLWAGSIGLVLTFRMGVFGLPGRVAALAVVGVVFTTAVLWLANIAVSSRHARMARRVAWFIFGLVLFGMIDYIVLRDLFGYSGAGGPFWGVARLATVVLLSYTILKHEVLGFDVGIRWGVSRTTVAAIFIAVFFVVSEAAQEFLGETIGSTYAGIAAAGALVFAIAPLQRAAERLAEKAVPVASVPFVGEGSAETRRESSYRKAVRLAMRDRRISREEEGDLHELARDLGIDGARAHAILVEIERAGDGTKGEGM